MEPEIIPYNPSLKSLFKELNVEWLSKYYFVTEADDKILSDPEKIIHDGGCILFVKLDDAVVGTCALLKKTEEEYGLAKMGVTERVRGKGVGSLLLNSIIEEANRRGAKLISLETAYPLKAAISLYKKFNFVQVSEERIHSAFGRKTFRMELSLNNR